MVEIPQLEELERLTKDAQRLEQQLRMVNLQLDDCSSSIENMGIVAERIKDVFVLYREIVKNAKLEE